MKSENHLRAARLLVENNLLEESVSMAYYSMYHLLTALLSRIGITCENHTASIMLLNDIFGMSNKGLKRAKRERIDKQYSVRSSITVADVKQFIQEAQEFNGVIIEAMYELKREAIGKYRGQFRKLL